MTKRLAVLPVWIASASFGCAGGASAEELEIGHLEATDDVGVNWQYYDCNKAGNTLHCHIFQSFINREIEPKDRQGQIEQRAKEISPEYFRQQFGTSCSNVDAIRTSLLASLSSGRNADGTPLGKQESIDMRESIDLLQAACKNTSPANIRKMIEHTVDVSTRTCVVTNMHSEDTMHWNSVMQAWESRSPQTGPCGNIVETRLRHDPTTASFWLSEERHMMLNRTGTLPTGQSCSAWPAEHTYHFSWRAANNALECTYIKNRM